MFALFAPVIFVAILVLAINFYIIVFAKPYIKSDVNQLPCCYTAIVPGAKVYSDRVVSFVFRDRIEGGIELINSNRANKLLISGDHGRKSYDELNAASYYIKQRHSLNPDLIFLDHAGFSTYETLYRAKEIFCVTDAIIVTQKFHLFRSVYIARKLGINAYGYEAKAINRFRKSTKLFWELREMLARVKNFYLVLKKPAPTYLGEQIPITGSSSPTYDR